MVREMEVDGAGGHDDRTPILFVKADNMGVTTAVTLLKTINFCEKVNVFISLGGIRFVVEEGKYVQSAVHLKAELFKTFNVREEGGFKIPFKELLDCLKILGADGKVTGSGGDSTDGTMAIAVGPASARSLQMTYHGYGSPFCLSLEEAGMVTEIELKTEEVDDLMDFDELEKKWQIIMDAKLLQEFLADLDSYAPEHVILRVVPNKCIEFRTGGVADSLKITIPKSCQLIEKFCAVTEIQQAFYRFSVLRNSFKLIQAADKVILSMAEQDVLYFNLVFKDNLASFADFYAMPLAELDLEEEFSDSVDH